jgi:hypothetical protein
MSKDGDWVLREDEEATGHVLDVLARRGARYRFGAPLDVRWLAGGWSSHLEHSADALRIRTDFISRPPRLSAADLERLWHEAAATGNDVVPLEALARIKMSLREKDYAVIGELARRMTDPRAALTFSRSSRDLIRLAAGHPDALAEVRSRRPLLDQIPRGREALEAALDQERRALMRSDEARMARYRDAAAAWASAWPDVSRRIAGLSLHEVHRVMTESAEGVLPFTVPEASADG